jgi:hypothetical protein
MEESLAALGGGGDRTTEEKLKVADNWSPNLIVCGGDRRIIFQHRFMNIMPYFAK